MADNWWESWVPAVAPYAVLLHLFTEKAMSGDAFELVFLHSYKNDPTRWPRELFDCLDGLFADVDAYSGDDRLRQETDGIGEAELRRRAKMTLNRLEGLAGGSTS